MNIMWIMSSYGIEHEETNAVSGPLKLALTENCGDGLRLTIVYKASPGNCTKIVRGSTTYLPIDSPLDQMNLDAAGRERLKNDLLRVVAEQKPELIQCFGSEWPYSAVAQETGVPVAVHLMGFLNIYYPSMELIPGRGIPNRRGKSVIARMRALAGRCRRALLRKPAAPNAVEVACALERRTMQVNRYFMGRTQWDRNIVRYYSTPDARYFHVAEAIKPAVYRAAGSWRRREGEKLRLLTVSSADDRKGNEIILRTARLLKELLGLDFEWRVAGQRQFFPSFEEHAGIRCGDVNVELLGMLDTEQIVRELQEADLFIHPSLIDNSPHAVCEAQLIGCPVIASNVGGVPQLVEDGVTGFLYPYNEPHTLAFLIGDLWRDRERCRRISAQETVEAVRRHDPQTIACALTEAYRTILEVEKNGKGRA